MGCKPIVKWAGGKRAIVDKLLKTVASASYGPGRRLTMRHYVEPFVGGGALFFALSHPTLAPFKSAILSDKNRDLITLYEVVRDSVDELIHELAQYKYSEVFFYKIRDKKVSLMTKIERGARALYLNKTCYNGLWRVNSKGQFNVPFGRYDKPNYRDVASLKAASQALSRAELRCGDFSLSLKQLRSGDFVYFDPPYVPVSKTANFTNYVKGGFNLDDQKRLLDEFVRLTKLGVHAMVSNHDTPETRALYKDFFIISLKVSRSINCDENRRGKIGELLACNWKPKNLNDL